MHICFALVCRFCTAFCGLFCPAPCESILVLNSKMRSDLVMSKSNLRNKNKIETKQNKTKKQERLVVANLKSHANATLNSRLTKLFFNTSNQNGLKPYELGSGIIESY